MLAGDVAPEVDREVSSSEAIGDGGSIMLILASEQLSELKSGSELEHSSSSAGVFSVHLVSCSFCKKKKRSIGFHIYMYNAYLILQLSDKYVSPFQYLFVMICTHFCYYLNSDIM